MTIFQQDFNDVFNFTFIEEFDDAMFRHQVVRLAEHAREQTGHQLPQIRS